MNIFEEVEKRQVEHICTKCKTRYCKPKRDKRCAFCNSKDIIVKIPEGVMG